MFWEPFEVHAPFLWRSDLAEVVGDDPQAGVAGIAVKSFVGAAVEPVVFEAVDAAGFLCGCREWGRQWIHDTGC